MLCIQWLLGCCPQPMVLQATGLALPGSDLDIVVLNVGPHLQRAGTGFTQAQVRCFILPLRSAAAFCRCILGSFRCL